MNACCGLAEVVGERVISALIDGRIPNPKKMDHAKSQNKIKGRR